MGSEDTFIEEKLELCNRITFKPGLALIAFRTTSPRCFEPSLKSELLIIKSEAKSELDNSLL